MFVLCTLKDTIRIAPHTLPNPNTIDATAGEYIQCNTINDILYDELSIKYNNTVVRNCGLIVSIYAISDTGDYHLPSNDGGIHITCIFQCITLQPHINELLYGRIESCTQDGIVLTTEWYNNIFIPYTELQSNTQYDSTENVFIWSYDSQQYYMDIGMMVCMRVTNVLYTELKPIHLKNSTTNNNMTELAELVNNDILLKISENNHVFQQPMIILASVNEDGLGCIEWWN